jgi:large subunit ribosomal protein L21e
MVKASHGLRRKGRNILKKSPRARGLSPITHEFVQFDVGEQAHIHLDPSIVKGAPHIRFHGKTGTVKAAQGRAYVLSVGDGDKYKTVVSRPEHMRKVKN